MTRLKELAAVAHNVAHHAASGLSFLSPHVTRALRAVGEETTAIELLAEHPYPPKIAEEGSLRAALASLKTKAQTILEKQGFEQQDVLSMVLHVTPNSEDHSGYWIYTRVVIIAKNGQVYDSGWLYT